MTLPPLLHIRHGETGWNRIARLQGQQDIPLSDLGRRQAGRNGRVLGSLALGPDWRWIASPLGRTVETARLVAAAADAPGRAIPTDARLVEVSFGDWEGRTLAEVGASDPAALDAREADKWSFEPPGGESYRAMAARVAAWLAEVDGPTVIVAHGGTLRALLHLVCGMEGRRAAHQPVPQDRLALFRDGACVLI